MHGLVLVLMWLLCLRKFARGGAFLVFGVGGGVGGENKTGLAARMNCDTLTGVCFYYLLHRELSSTGN